MVHIELDDLFLKNRFPKTTWKLLTILLYSPLGLALAILRLFILIQAYVAASLMPEISLIRRFVLRMICVVLGVIVQEEGRSQTNRKAKVLIANHSTIFDHIPLHLVTGCIAFQPSISSPIVDLTWGLKDLGIRQGKEIFKKQLQEFLNKAESPLLIRPEEETTSGKIGLLKFSSWYGVISSNVQPVCLKVWRPPITDIAPTVLQFSAVSDLFWFLFTPFTVFKIKYLPDITRTPGETDEALFNRIESAIAKELGLQNTNYTASDKAELQKRYIRELQKPVLITGDSSSINAYEIKLRNHKQKMAAQVSEVLPHVPLDAILADLSKTRNIDVTISNFLEGVVQYDPIIPSVIPDQTALRDVTDTKSSCSSSRNQLNKRVNQEHSFSKSAQDRMLSLEDRKNHMIETARKRYIQRHGLNV